MSEPITNSRVEDVLSSIKRLVGETKRQGEAEPRFPANDMFVLTPQLRVTESDVLKLTPEDAVAPAKAWYEFEEPPLPQYVHRRAEAVADESHVPQGAPKAPQIAVQANAVAPEVPETPETPVPQRPTNAMELSAKIAALETAIAKTVDQWEPDGPGQDPYSGTQSPAMTWQDNIELDGTGIPLQAVTEVAVSATAVAVEQVLEDAVEAQVIDEETLRTMVAQIVRSELQGELGERITRNVRKLVRREIHRALTAQSMD